jgi:uncharacterized protein (DUF433 family)
LSVSVKKIKHPYITINKKVRGGEPVITGTGIRVLDIAIRYEIMGMTPDDIMVGYPHLNLPQIHDALSYYYEHKEEIDRKWQKAMKSVKTLKNLCPSVLEKKIGKVKNLYR